MEGGHKYKKGLWNSEEDRILMDYVKDHGVGKWNRIAKLTGLKRCGKSCRLRWMNYLSPDVKRGDFSEEEDDLIIRLHNLLGNRWSLIAGRVPGRTDNQVKNYWNTHLCKKLMGVNKKGKSKVCQPPEPSFSLPNQPHHITHNSNSPSNKPPSSDCTQKAEEAEKFVQATSLSAQEEGGDHQVIMSDDDVFDATFWIADDGLGLYPSSFSYPNCHDYFADLDRAGLYPSPFSHPNYHDYFADLDWPPFAN